MIKKKVSIVLIFFLLCGCAQLGINLNTTEKKHAAARAELNLLLERYISIQGDVADTDHQNAKWAFVTADASLDAWERQLGNPDYEWYQDMETWLDCKNIIIAILGRYK